MAPLRGPSSHERLWLASGCPFASAGVRRCPGSTKGYSLLRSRRIRWSLCRFFTLDFLLVSLCGASSALRASSEHRSPEVDFVGEE